MWLASTGKRANNWKDACCTSFTGEHFYLQLLLTVKRGAQLYRELYIVNGIECVSPSAACRALGLLADEREWVEFIGRIKDTATAFSLRMTLASIITNSLVTSAQAIWDQFKDFFTDDCQHRLSLYKDIINPPPADWTGLKKNAGMTKSKFFLN